MYKQEKWNRNEAQRIRKGSQKEKRKWKEQKLRKQGIKSWKSQ